MHREEPEGTPSTEAVEEDFTVPDDADLKPIDPETGKVEDTPTEPAEEP